MEDYARVRFVFVSVSHITQFLFQPKRSSLSVPLVRLGAINFPENQIVNRIANS